MPPNWTPTPVRPDGEYLTGASYQADRQQAANADVPQMQDDYSATLTEMQAATDPAPGGTPSLPTTLAGELERVRFALRQIKQVFAPAVAQWYQPLPAVTLPPGPEGPPGPQGPAGATGAQGPAGPGVAAGGTTGQLLAKLSAADYATQWVDAPSGGAGAPTGAPYVTTAADATLTNETVLASGAGLSLTGATFSVNGTATTALLDVFTSTLKGLAPASGGGSVNFLRADGTWAEPAGAGGAPTTARYFVAAADATLTQEHVMTANSPVQLTLGAPGTTAILDIVGNSIGDAHLVHRSGNSVIGRSASTFGATNDIIATNDGNVLRRSGTTLAFGPLNLAGGAQAVTGILPAANMDPAFAASVADNAVTNLKLADMPTARLKGRVTAATGDPEDLTGTQATTLLDAFAGTAKGLVPTGSGNVATVYLNGQGAWTTPAGGDGGAPTDAQYYVAAANATLTAEVVLSGTAPITLTAGAIALADDGVTDVKLRNSVALSVIGRSANTTGDPADIAAGTDGHVLCRASTTLGFGQVQTAGIADTAVTFPKIRSVSPASVLGRPENTSGAVSDIIAGSDGHVLRRSAGFLGFGTVVTAGIAANAIDNTKLVDMATATIKGRVTAATGDPEDLTGTQATTLLDVFTPTLKGLAPPATGGGTVNFLRADGTWAQPPGTGGVTFPITIAQGGTNGTTDAAARTNLSVFSKAEIQGGVAFSGVGDAGLLLANDRYLKAKNVAGVDQYLIGIYTDDRLYFGSGAGAPMVFSSASAIDFSPGAASRAQVNGNLTVTGTGGVKAAGYIDGVGGIDAGSFGIASVTHPGVGQYVVTWTTARTTPTYPVVATVHATVPATAYVFSITTSAVEIRIWRDDTNALSDGPFMIAMF